MALTVAGRPSGPPPGDVEQATLRLLRRAQRHPGEADAVLAAAYGVGAWAGQPPQPWTALAAGTGSSAGVLWQRMGSLRRWVAPLGLPDSLQLAMDLAADLVPAPAIQLSLAWCAAGHTARGLHPRALLAIAGLFGAPRTFELRRSPTLSGPIAAPPGRGDQLLSDLLTAVAAVRAARMLPANQLPAALLPLLALGGIEVAEGWAVDGRVGGLDRCLARVLAAAETPLPVDTLRPAVHRWHLGQVHTRPDPTTSWLTTYLHTSPHWTHSTGRRWTHAAATHTGAGAAAGPARGPQALTAEDHLLLASVRAAGGVASRADLLEVLLAAGAAGLPAAAHRLTTTPILTRTGYGTYTVVSAGPVSPPRRRAASAPRPATPPPAPPDRRPGRRRPPGPATGHRPAPTPPATPDAVAGRPAAR